MSAGKTTLVLKSLKNESDKYVYKLSCRMLDTAEKYGRCKATFSEDCDYSAARLYKSVRDLAEHYHNDCTYKRHRVGKDSVYVKLLTKPQTDLKYVINSLEQFGNSVISGGAVRQLGFAGVDSFISERIDGRVKYTRPSEAYGATDSEKDSWIVTLIEESER